MDPRTPPPSPDHESASLMSAEPPASTSADQGGWKVESVNIRQADNGGFTVSCSKKREVQSRKGGSGAAPMDSNYKSTDYVFSDLGKMLEYVASEFSGGQPAATEQPKAPPIPARALGGQLGGGAAAPVEESDGEDASLEGEDLSDEEA